MSLHHRRLNQRRWSIARRAALERDGYRCTNTDCAKAGKMEVHHITALARGGSPYELANLENVVQWLVTLNIAVFPPPPGMAELHVKTKFQEINQ